MQREPAMAASPGQVGSSTVTCRSCFASVCVNTCRDHDAIFGTNMLALLEAAVEAFEGGEAIAGLNMAAGMATASAIQIARTQARQCELCVV